MPEREARKMYPADRGQGLSGSRLDFSHRISQYASRDRPRPEFLSDVMKLVLEHSGCAAVEMWLDDGADALRCEAFGREDGSGAFAIVPGDRGTGHPETAGRESCPDLEKLCASAQRSDHSGRFLTCTAHGSVCIHDTRQLFSLDEVSPFQGSCICNHADGGYLSLAMVPLRSGKDQIGLLMFKGRSEGSIDPGRLEYLETIAAKLELALLHQFSQAKLHERVKELMCLYGIAKTASEPGVPFEQKLMNVVMLLPPAWQYPTCACARIVVDGHAFQTPSFTQGAYKQGAPVVVRGRTRGVVEVHYSGQRPFPGKSPFLDEEQSLINSVAGQIAQMIEQREAEIMKAELQDQLTRADRLAAIGQLASGVAHELNEPLNTILGFAQLVQKTEGVPAQALQDIGKITEASLHARNIIRELLVFARQSAPSRGRVDLNRIIEEELSLFESLCSKSGVELRRTLASCLPAIIANKSQILQVISNLMVNALQAMPEGGTITLSTAFDHAGVFLTVRDTGIGMSEEVKNNIFLPFFTTKDVDQGTGLGLAVVHGIVASHGGRITVESEPGEGARFVLTFPYGQAGEAEEE